MHRNDKELIVVGDRVLVAIEDGEERTKVGLYLPPTAMDNQAVQGGRIVATGPGLPMPDTGESGDEPWRTAVARDAVRADAGAHRRLRAVFPEGGRRDHVRGRHYLVVPQGAILALVRDAERRRLRPASRRWTVRGSLFPIQRESGPDAESEHAAMYESDS